jgi:antitoxin (DNA-binding transcriptional repressor) of toxin-antitoxin stability system
MLKLNIHEAKTHLSRYLEKLKKGEVILLCKRNEPITKIQPLSTQLNRKRPIGLAKGQLTIPTDFLDRLPDDVSQAFHGQS